MPVDLGPDVSGTVVLTLAHRQTPDSCAWNVCLRVTEEGTFVTPTREVPLGMVEGLMIDVLDDVDALVGDYIDRCKPEVPPRVREKLEAWEQASQ